MVLTGPPVYMIADRVELSIGLTDIVDYMFDYRVDVYSICLIT